MFTGIGFASLTKEKIEEVAQDFIEQGKMSEQEGKKLVDELMNRSKESQEEFSKQVEELVKTGLEKMNVAKTADIEALRQEIAELRQQLHEQGKTE